MDIKQEVADEFKEETSQPSQASAAGEGGKGSKVSSIGDGKQNVGQEQAGDHKSEVKTEGGSDFKEAKQGLEKSQLNKDLVADGKSAEKCNENTHPTPQEKSGTGQEGQAKVNTDETVPKDSSGCEVLTQSSEPAVPCPDQSSSITEKSSGESQQPTETVEMAEPEQTLKAAEVEKSSKVEDSVVKETTVSGQDQNKSEKSLPEENALNTTTSECDSVEDKTDDPQKVCSQDARLDDKVPSKEGSKTEKIDGKNATEAEEKVKQQNGVNESSNIEHSEREGTEVSNVGCDESFVKTEEEKDSASESHKEEKSGTERPTTEDDSRNKEASEKSSESRSQTVVRKEEGSEKDGVLTEQGTSQDPEQKQIPSDKSHPEKNTSDAVNEQSISKEILDNKSPDKPKDSKHPSADVSISSASTSSEKDKKLETASVEPHETKSSGTSESLTKETSDPACGKSVDVSNDVLDKPVLGEKENCEKESETDQSSTSTPLKTVSTDNADKELTPAQCVTEPVQSAEHEEKKTASDISSISTSEIPKQPPDKDSPQLQDGDKQKGDSGSTKESQVNDTANKNVAFSAKIGDKDQAELEEERGKAGSSKPCGKQEDEAVSGALCNGVEDKDLNSTITDGHTPKAVSKENRSDEKADVKSSDKDCDDKKSPERNKAGTTQGENVNAYEGSSSNGKCEKSEDGHTKAASPVVVTKCAENGNVCEAEKSQDTNKPAEAEGGKTSLPESDELEKKQEQAKEKDEKQGKDNGEEDAAPVEVKATEPEVKKSEESQDGKPIGEKDKGMSTDVAEKAKEQSDNTGKDADEVKQPKKESDDCPKKDEDGKEQTSGSAKVDSGGKEQTATGTDKEGDASGAVKESEKVEAEEIVPKASEANAKEGASVQNTTAEAEKDKDPAVKQTKEEASKKENQEAEAKSQESSKSELSNEVESTGYKGNKDEKIKGAPETTVSMAETGNEGTKQTTGEAPPSRKLKRAAPGAGSDDPQDATEPDGKRARQAARVQRTRGGRNAAARGRAAIQAAVAGSESDDSEAHSSRGRRGRGRGGRNFRGRGRKVAKASRKSESVDRAGVVEDAATDPATQEKRAKVRHCLAQW